MSRGKTASAKRKAKTRDAASNADEVRQTNDDIMHFLFLFFSFFLRLYWFLHSIVFIAHTPFARSLDISDTAV